MVAIANSGAAYGTQLAVINTEHTLATVVAAGVYQLQVDLSNMVAGDAIEVRFKYAAKPGGTVRTSDVLTVSDAQPTDGMILSSVPIPMDTQRASLAFTLKQVRGVGRNFDWSVVAL